MALPIPAEQGITWGITFISIIFDYERVFSLMDTYLGV